MSVYRAGSRRARYQDRVADCLRDVCHEAGDHNVFVDGVGPYCIVIDRETFKLDDGDRGVNSSTIQACWLKSDCIQARPRSIINSGPDSFVIKGSPVDQYDGWVCAELSATCETC